MPVASYHWRHSSAHAGGTMAARRTNTTRSGRRRRLRLTSMLITVSGVAVLGVAPAGHSGQPAAHPPDRLSRLVAEMALEEKLSFVQGRWDDPQRESVG